MSDLSTSSGIPTTDSNEGTSHVVAIAERESKQVRASRLLMIAVFLLVASGLAIVTYFYMSRQEEDDFEATFSSLAKEVIKVSQIQMDNSFDLLKSHSDALTSYALGANATWPFVTHPNYQYVAETARASFNARLVAFGPVVEPSKRDEWDAWCVQQQGWMQESLDYLGMNLTAAPITPYIFKIASTPDSSFVYTEDVGYADYPFLLPLWQATYAPSVFFSPLADKNAPLLNFNLWNAFNPGVHSATKRMFDSALPVMTEPYGDWGAIEAVSTVPEIAVMQPVFDSFRRDKKIVAFASSIMEMHLFSDILSDEGRGIIAVVNNPCSTPTAFTWKIQGQDAIFVGPGNLHDSEYSKYRVHEMTPALRTNEECPYSMSLYPSAEFEDRFMTSEPVVYTFAVILIFLITLVFFFLYDFLVEKRQGKVMHTAKQSGAIVDSLFPANVRDRLMEDERASGEKGSSSVFGFPIIGGKEGSNGKTGSAPRMFATKPIADYYPIGTVIVADIANFSAWSSVREPSQVFTLLETLYTGMDTIAKRRRVFKVETLADCYVACTNVPDPLPDHAVVMARFARDCRQRMLETVQQLEIWLGPDTSALRMRFAINTGPVTAGVLRGQKSRFQLFGSTIDLCFRLEEEGEENEILISQATADLIHASGRGYWLTPRTEKLFLKGKGEVQTYWLHYHNSKNETMPAEAMEASVSREARSPFAVNEDAYESQQRLIDWGVDVLGRLLKMIMAVRVGSEAGSSLARNKDLHPNGRSNQKKLDGQTALDEVVEIITLRNEEGQYKCDPARIELNASVENQLRSYVTAIASVYNNNPFHNFQHACHVTQAVTKLLSRVVTPDMIDTNTMTYRHKAEATELHQDTYGIISDPLIQFACALSALIHDVDHPGVPNAQLVKEETRHAKMYKNKSVAEQNSVDLAWDMLMGGGYEDPRMCIYSSEAELDRFRQLVVNSVMATDIVDKELGALRKNRWNKAFGIGDVPMDEERTLTEKNKSDRKATIVIEHLVQAADVSHMMQHWHVYIKWNEFFFQECYKAYLAGRAEKDPSVGWYKGELGFFEFYTIPLAKKLENCGVFGVSSDEFLNYAEANHREWALKGEEIVSAYLENFKKEYPDASLR